MTLACALKGNGLLKYVASASGCSSKQGTLVRLGVSSPVSLCRQPDGSVRLIPPRDCTKASGTMFTIPSNTPAYFCVNLSSGGALRYVSEPSRCTSTETAFVVVNHAPTDIALNPTPTSVAENEPAGTIVGTFSASDLDAGDSHTFTLVSGDSFPDNAAFSMSGNHTLTTAASFDYETKSSYAIRVQAKDALGLTYTKTFTITVTDVPEGPVAMNDAATVDDDSADNQIDVLANDIDAGGPMSVQSVTSPLHGTVTITVGGTGVSYTPTAGYCNPAVRDTFTYTLNGGSSATVSITVRCAPKTLQDCQLALAAAGQPVPDPAIVNYIWGNNGNDNLSATAGIDVICGFAGFDSVQNEPKAGDIFLGGTGNDTVGSLGGGTFIGGDGTDAIEGFMWSGAFDGGADRDVVDNFLGGTFNGGDGDDYIGRMHGGGTFNGGDGVDGVGELNSGTFNGDTGNDRVSLMRDTHGTFNGGTGNDYVHSMSTGRFNGGDGPDEVFDMSGGTFNGDDGDDHVENLHSGATFRGGGGCDSVTTNDSGVLPDLGDEFNCSG